MAIRPIFVANPNKSGIFVEIINIEFKWYPGYSVSQKQKSITSLHEAASKIGYKNILEVSSKSESMLGNELSAFNLKLKLPGSDKRITVESAFQGSKVFENGGPFTDFYEMSGKQIKTDSRLKDSGKLLKFIFNGDEWPLEPKTLFYDWIYIQALNENQDIASKILEYSSFTDIEFNPKKSFNCQARSCALYNSLHKLGLLKKCLENKGYFQQLVTGSKMYTQMNLFTT